MAIVSISKASKLTGKSRTTLHQFIKGGKLSKCTDEQGRQGIDISELLRVFGSLKSEQPEHNKNSSIEQGFTVKNEQLNSDLKHENNLLKEKLNLMQQLLDEKDKRNDDLKQSLLLLEHQSDKKRKKFLWIF